MCSLRVAGYKLRVIGYYLLVTRFVLLVASIRSVETKDQGK